MPMPKHPKNAAPKRQQTAQKDYVRSLPESELMRRLEKRYSKQAAPAVDAPEAKAEEIQPKRPSELLLRARDAMGMADTDAATTLVAQAAALPATEISSDVQGPEKSRMNVQAAVELIEQIRPEGALQSMLVAQMIGVHNTAIKFLMRASITDQTFEGTDANVLRATRLFRLFNEQLQALESLRGQKGQQHVTVEHVHVYEGGQAIVGNVTPGGSNET
jgi:hypothetical protein